MIAEEGEIPIIYRDEHIIAIDKPSGLLSQPNPNRDGGSILNVLKGMGVPLIGGEDPARQGLIHRLDRDTSGVLLLSLSQQAYEKFQELFKKRTVAKTLSLPSLWSSKKNGVHKKGPSG